MSTLVCLPRDQLGLTSALLLYVDRSKIAAPITNNLILLAMGSLNCIKRQFYCELKDLQAGHWSSPSIVTRRQLIFCSFRALASCGLWILYLRFSKKPSSEGSHCLEQSFKIALCLLTSRVRTRKLVGH